VIFPDWGTLPPEEGEDLPLLVEWAVDWEAGRFALRNGAFYTVSGLEALKIWTARALRPESRRFLYTAWSWDYGNELEELLGGCVDQGILESRLRQYIREALLASPYISAVDGFSFSKRGSLVTADFTVRSAYASFEEKLEVRIG